MRQPYLTLADLAVIYGISPRTARRWAQHDRWRRTGTRPVRYSLADAQGSYERHKRRGPYRKRHAAQLAHP
jgi:uncharacterized protein YjcR